MLQAVRSEHVIVVSWNDWLPPAPHEKRALEQLSQEHTIFFLIFAKSPLPTFPLLIFPLEENRHFNISFPNRLFCQAIRKYKLFSTLGNLSFADHCCFDTNMLLLY